MKAEQEKWITEFTAQQENLERNGSAYKRIWEEAINKNVDLALEYKSCSNAEQRSRSTFTLRQAPVIAP